MNYTIKPKAGQLPVQQELIPPIEYKCPGCGQDVKYQPTELLTYYEITCGNCDFVVEVELEEEAPKKPKKKKPRKQYYQSHAELTEGFKASLYNIYRLQVRKVNHWRKINRFLNEQLGEIAGDDQLRTMISVQGKAKGNSEHNIAKINERYKELKALHKRKK